MGTKDDREKSRDERLEELAVALKEAQLMLLKQSAQLEELGHRDAEPGRALAATNEQLAVVTAERDQLQRQLLALERMQTETIALPDGHDTGPDTRARLPTINELMADLCFTPEGTGPNASRYQLSGPSAEAPETDFDEMIAPEVIAPEVFGQEQRSAGSEAEQQPARLLVYMDSDRPAKVPLLDGTMTIGRSASANIRIDGDHVSRIHARIICRPSETVIEDAGSTNGFKVNSVAVRRHNLKHGDVISLGGQRFTFIDLSDER